MSAAFIRSLAETMARHPEAVHSNTPLDVLAAHMFRSLQLFEASLIERAHHPFYQPGTIAVPSSNAAVHPLRADGDSGDLECGLYRDMPGRCAKCEED